MNLPTALYWIGLHVKWILWGFFFFFLTYTCVFSLTHVLLCACLVFRELVLSYSTGHTTHWGGHSTIIVFSSFLYFYISRRHGFWEMTFFPPPFILSTVRKCNSMKPGLRPNGLRALAVTIGFQPFLMDLYFHTSVQIIILFRLLQWIGQCKFTSNTIFSIVKIAHMEFFYLNHCCTVFIVRHFGEMMLSWL